MKPILFNTEMVQAILAGRKTTTRRPLKEPFEVHANGYITKQKGNERLVPYKAPYQKEDIIYVRETWRVGAWNQDSQSIAVDYKSDNESIKKWVEVESSELFEKLWIQSSEDAEKSGIKFDRAGEYHWEPGEAPTRWRPSIHMPKEVARIFLKVIDVRVERLQDITEDGSIKEGISDVFQHKPHHDGSTAVAIKINHMAQFKTLWNSVYKNWDENPWVWVIEFEKIKKPERDGE